MRHNAEVAQKSSLRQSEYLAVKFFVSTNYYMCAIMETTEKACTTTYLQEAPMDSMSQRA